jgi:hypothetical protein
VELNHRSQVCEALTGTGVRVAKRIPSALNPAPGLVAVRQHLRPYGASAGGPDSHGKVDGDESNALSIPVWKVFADGHRVCL